MTETKTSYYDAVAERYQTITYTDMRTMAGRVSGPAYDISYRLVDGRWLNGVRHTDRGDLMTCVAIGARPTA